MSSPTPPLKRSSLKYILMLGALAALPAVTVDMYLPSLPTVQAELMTHEAAVQMTISAMLLGGGVGQLVIGPLADRFGRRLPLLVGIGLHVVFSILCSLAQNIELLIALRFGQGFFNAAASVVAIAVIRDRFVGSDAARLLSRLMLVIGVAPLFAPTIGQLIAGVWHWRAVFYALALIGVVLALIVWRWMPETLPPQRRTRPGTGTRGFARSYATLLRDRSFMALAVVPGFGMAVILSYVVGSPFVFQEEFGLSGGQFALLFAANGCALVGSAQINATLVRRVSPARLLRVAAVVQTVFAVLLLIVAVTGVGGLPAMIGALWLVLGAQGMIPPNASVLALSGYGHMAGTAAAVIGALQAGIAGVLSPLVGVLGGDATAMATVMLGSVLCTVLVLLLGTPIYRKDGWMKLGQESDGGTAGAVTSH